MLEHIEQVNKQATNFRPKSQNQLRKNKRRDNILLLVNFITEKYKE